MKTLRVADLRFDGVNPRHDPTTGQPEILEALMAKEGPKVARLAADIAENGVNPIDLLLVLEEPGPAYTVIEGNRRLAALKLLIDPSLAANANYSSQFESLQGKVSKPITAVACHIVATREEAKHWQQIRHGGEDGGRGVVPWNPAAAHRFFGRTGDQVSDADKLISALKKAYPANKALLADFERVLAERPSTFGRLLGDPDVRRRLGIVLRPTVVAHYSSADLEQAFMRMASDFASGGLTVAHVDSKRDRAAYLATLGPVLPDEAKRRPRASPFVPLRRAAAPPPPGKTPTPAPARPGTSALPAGRTAPTPVTPRRLFEGIRLPKFSARIQNILGELQRLDVDSYPNASAVLMRVVIDLVVAEVFDRKGWPTTVVRRGKNPRDKQLAEKVRECLDKLDPSGKDKKWQSVRVGLSDPNGMFAMTTLNAWLHNPRFHPVPSHLRLTAANYADFLTALDTLI